MGLFLGVDGGGTKTAFLLVDEHGTTLAQTRERSTYYFGSDRGIELVGDVLDEGISALEAASGLSRDRITAAFVGLPGYGEWSADAAALDAIPARVLGHDRVRVGNDTVCGWAGSLGGADGINIVAGTGSISYGEHAGRAHRAGGWSELFGDEGSGYWIAVQGLNAFTRMSDGRLDRGPLHALLRERLGVSADLDAIGVVMNDWGGGRTAIADLSSTVGAAAEAGDATALGILAAAGHELAALVGATRDPLGWDDDEAVPVSYSGGVFSAPRVLDAFAAALESAPRPSELRTPIAGPALGAALYAMRLAGAALPPLPR
jgi:N-acetylglucosamine kinase-like BadF-type ATPase